ncbi:MAG: hypothetical protein ACJ796_20615 [Gemmatimonadaceae bacterium]
MMLRIRQRQSVPNGGMKRAFKFNKGDIRILAEQTLETQLAQTEYVAEERFDPVAHGEGATGIRYTPGERPR